MSVKPIRCEVPSRTVGGGKVWEKAVLFSEHEAEVARLKTEHEAQVDGLLQERDGLQRAFEELASKCGISGSYIALPNGVREDTDPLTHEQIRLALERLAKERGGA